MNGCRFMNFSSDASFPNKPMVGEIAVDPLQKKVFVYMDERWVEIRQPAPQLHVPTMRKHSATCPRCGAPCSPYQEKCNYCDSYFEF